MLSLIGSEFDELLDSIFLDLTTCLTYMDMSFKIIFFILKKNIYFFIYYNHLFKNYWYCTKKSILYVIDFLITPATSLISNGYLSWHLISFVRVQTSLELITTS